MGDSVVFLHNIYAPTNPRRRLEFFQALPRDFPESALHIIGGDFNCILSPGLDSNRPTTYSTTGAHELVAWTTALNVLDVFRWKNPLKRSFTSPTLSNRLDYIFLSSRWAKLPHIKASHLAIQPNTDHIPCQVFTRRPAIKSGPGPWKVPQWLLRHPPAHKIIESCLDHFLSKTTLTGNIGLKFDKMSTQIRDRLKTIHDEIVTAQAQPLKDLSIELAQLVLDFQRTPNDAIQAQIRRVQREIHTIHDKTKEFRLNTALRAHLEKAERCTKFHLRQPKVPMLRKTAFKELRTASGNVVSSQTALEDTLHEFYTNLYASNYDDHHDQDSYLTTNITKKLSMHQRRELAAPLLANEFYHAIKTSKPNSTPGPNAL
ncbi:hypothetical protein DYB32_009984, partial [Aphanomyces invadans]